MVSSETCSSGASGTNTYGVSFNISPYFTVEGKQWRKHNRIDQMKILRSIYCTLVMSYTGQEPDHSAYIFEETQKRNIHLHAILFCRPAEIDLMQQDVYKNYSYKKDPIDRVFHYSQTIVHRKFWDRYMAKEQKDNADYIPDYNMCL